MSSGEAAVACNATAHQTQIQQVESEITINIRIGKSLVDDDKNKKGNGAVPSTLFVIGALI